MKANRKIGLFLILSALISLLAGCPAKKHDTVAAADTAALKPDSAQRQNDVISKRFQEAASGGQTVVDSAIKLAQEYAKLSEKMTALQQKNQELVTENSQLKDRIAAIGPELEQAKKELAGANDLLVEMRIELNNWKSNILGFRDEMRSADKVQLETLLKILEILGGEVKPAPSDANKAAQAGASAQQGQALITSSPDIQNKPRTEETNIPGEPNE